jgi:hypothetical protein
MADDDIRATVNDDSLHSLRQETLRALYAEYDRLHPVRRRHAVWVMSTEWRDYLRTISRAAPAIPEVGLVETLIGIPIEVREDAGFPKLIQS